MRNVDVARVCVCSTCACVSACAGVCIRVCFCQYVYVFVDIPDLLRYDLSEHAESYARVAFAPVVGLAMSGREARFSYEKLQRVKVVLAGKFGNNQGNKGLHVTTHDDVIRQSNTGQK